MSEPSPNGRQNGERVWTWVTRGLAVVGFIYLLATVGFDAPWGAFLLLLGLFFGPDVLKGQLQINRRVNGQGQSK